jgi:iron complex transport system substrate-binding protein
VVVGVVMAMLLPVLALAQDASPVPTGSSRTVYPLTIETCGRSVTFERAPERILVSYPTMTDTLFQLGLGDKIVGLAWKDGSDPLPEFAEAYAALPAVSTEGPAAKEPLLATRADFFFADGEYLFDPESGYATLDDLAASGMHAYVAASGCPDRRDTGTVADVFTDIANLGRIFDVQEEATALIAAEQVRIDAVQQAIAGRSLPRTAFAGVYGDELYALTGGTYGDIMRLAGAENIFTDLGIVFAPISAEEMLAENPEVLLVSYNVAAEIDAKEAEIRDHCPGLAAVENNQIIPVQEGTTSPGSTRAILAIEMLARELHPDAFADGATPEPAA